MARVEEIIKNEIGYEPNLEEVEVKVEKNKFIINLFKSLKESKFSNYSIKIDFPLRVVVVEKNNYIIIFKYVCPIRERDEIKIFKKYRNKLEEIKYKKEFIYMHPDTHECVSGLEIEKELKKLKNIFKAYFFGFSD